MSKERTRKQRVLVGIGTVAHNRPFSAADLSEYVGFDVGALVRGWAKRGLLKRVGREDIGRGRKEALYFPTKEGWAMIEGAVG